VDVFWYGLFSPSTSASGRVAVGMPFRVTSAHHWPLSWLRLEVDSSSRPGLARSSQALRTAHFTLLHTWHSDSTTDCHEAAWDVKAEELHVYGQAAWVSLNSDLASASELVTSRQVRVFAAAFVMGRMEALLYLLPVSMSRPYWQNRSYWSNPVRACFWLWDPVYNGYPDLPDWQPTRTKTQNVTRPWRTRTTFPANPSLLSGAPSRPSPKAWEPGSRTDVENVPQILVGFLRIANLA